MIDSLLTLLISVFTGLVTFLTLLNKVKREVNILVNPCTIIGVLKDIPDELDVFEDFTSLRKLRAGQGRIRVLHCRTLSYALRHCDFVVARASDDPRIVSPEDSRKLRAICQIPQESM